MRNEELGIYFLWNVVPFLPEPPVFVGAAPLRNHCKVVQGKGSETTFQKTNS